MPQPTNSQVHIDAGLSNLSISYKNTRYIADKVFPIVPVDKLSDYYYTWDKKYWFTNHVQRRAPGGAYERGGLTVSNTQYLCTNYGLGFDLPRETLQNQDAVINLEKKGADWLADQFMLNREANLASKIFGASAWTSSTTLSGNNQWSDYDNSNPINDIKTGIRAVQLLTGLKPNMAVMGAQVWDQIIRHPDLLEIYKYTEQAVLSSAQVSKAIDIPQIVVGEAIQDTQDEGLTMSGSYIWGKTCLLLYVPPSPGIDEASAGYCFCWKNQGFIVAIRKVPDELRNTDVLMGDHAFDQKITAADLGYEIINAVA